MPFRPAAHFRSSQEMTMRMQAVISLPLHGCDIDHSALLPVPTGGQHLGLPEVAGLMQAVNFLPLRFP